MDDHAAILEWLHAHRLGEVPKDETDAVLVCVPETPDRVEHFAWSAHDQIICPEYGFIARSLIKEKAWGVVRKWCAASYRVLHVWDAEEGVVKIFARAGAESIHKRLGTGPTDAAALLAALRWIGEQEGK